MRIIAEIATNHGGNMSLAKDFIDAYAPYVDTLKFQLIRPAHLRAGDPQTAWFRQAELSLDQLAALKAYTEQQGRDFLLTVYNADDVWELEELGLTEAKVGSGEAGDGRLAERLTAAGFDVLVSCGLVPPTATPYYVSTAPLYTTEGYHGVRYLGCVTRYPAPNGVATAMLAGDGALTGWSDHAIGLDELKAAVCMGAEILETHVQLPNQARQARPFEKTEAEMTDLRAFVDESPARFVGRWQA